jgi:phage replication-related protein YjqB (UPF0714/DUF867 family)
MLSRSGAGVAWRRAEYLKAATHHRQTRRGGSGMALAAALAQNVAMAGISCENSAKKMERIGINAHGEINEKRSSAMAKFGENINVGGVKASNQRAEKSSSKKRQIMSA